MNFIKIIFTFFILAFNYSLIQNNMIIGLIFLFIEICLFIRMKGNVFGFHFNSGVNNNYKSKRNYRKNNRISENNNNLILLLELMKLEQQPQQNFYPSKENFASKFKNQHNTFKFFSEEHKKIRSIFEN